MPASPKLSKASKMPCKSWSLPAWTTCPGSRDDAGEAVDACSKCYALQGRYLFKNVKAAREHNLVDWQRENWVGRMVSLIKDDRFFRWFDSGDIYCTELAIKIMQVCSRTLHTQHWIPTRSHKVDSIRPYLEAMNRFPNVTVRYSSDSIHGETIDSPNNSVVIQSVTDYDAGYGKVLCTSFKRQGQCGPCRACWSDQVKTVYYPLHGKGASKKIIGAQL